MMRYVSDSDAARSSERSARPPERGDSSKGQTVCPPCACYALLTNRAPVGSLWASEAQNTRLALSFSRLARIRWTVRRRRSDGERNAVVRAVRNEVKLHSALADKTVPFLMVYAEGETLEEVLASFYAGDAQGVDRDLR